LEVRWSFWDAFSYGVAFLMAGTSVYFSKQTIAIAARKAVPLASIAVVYGVMALDGGLSI